MGAWGTEIFDNDTSCDVRDEFVDYLEEGYSARKATKIILKEYLDDEEDLEEIALIYIGLSAIQLEKNCIQRKVKKKTIKLIEMGADLELWEDDPDAYEERKKVLNQFKETLINL
ncbi:MAG: DUF4259 domain-containing protein [Bacillaceae bacterium]